MDLSQTIHLLGDLLGRVISELESPAIFDIEERIRGLAKARRGGEANAASGLQAEVSTLHNEQARVVAAAFAAYFDLVNLAEEEARVQLLRQREDESYPEPVRESIGEAVIFPPFTWNSYGTRNLRVKFSRPSARNMTEHGNLF
jgi:phosphoenolpyruvate carboxylase